MNGSCAGVGSPLNSPSYSRRDVECTPPVSSPPMDSPPTALDSLPTYDAALPPIPDSPESHHSSPEHSPGPEASPMSSSPYGSHMKQTRHNIYTDSPDTRYDSVPAPRPLEPEYPKRRMSSPAESAKLNMVIKDESYVDMKMEPTIYDSVPLPRPANSGSKKQVQSPSSYDIVPLPVPSGGSTLRPKPCGSTYDIVPPPKSVLDEYVACDVPPQGKETLPGKQFAHKMAPAIPDPTYSGFDTLPAVENRSSQDIGYVDSSNDIYDIPPRTSQYSDSIYDVPPRPHDDWSQDSIYDTPPPTHDLGNIPHIVSSHHSESSYFGENEMDSIYDCPPKSASCIGADAIYDTPPSKHYSYTEDSIYDIPPTTQEITTAGMLQKTFFFITIYQLIGI